MTERLFRIADGFDGAWIIIQGADGKDHYFDERPYDGPAGAAMARGVIKRLEIELEEWGADAWCERYSIRRTVLPPEPPP